MDSQVSLIIMAGLGAVMTAIFGIVTFIVKDVYSKVGDLGAMKERVKMLEVHADDSKKTSEVVIRMEERMKDLNSKVDLLLAAVLKDKANNG